VYFLNFQNNEGIIRKAMAVHFPFSSAAVSQWAISSSQNFILTTDFNYGTEHYWRDTRDETVLVMGVS
jgi:hypothetical protein